MTIVDAALAALWIVGFMAIALMLRALARRSEPAALAALRRRCVELETAHAELVDELEKVLKLLSKKTQRETMRSRRENGAESYAPLPNETPQEHKERLRSLLRAGKIKPPEFRG